MVYDLLLKSEWGCEDNNYFTAVLGSRFGVVMFSPVGRKIAEPLSAAIDQ